MKHLVTVLVVIIFSYLGWIFLNSVQYGLCEIDQRYDCIYYLSDNYGHPLFYGSLFILIGTLITIPFRKRVTQTWFRFSTVAIPLLALWIVFTPVYCSAPLGMCVDKKMAVFLSGKLFLLGTLYIILWRVAWPWLKSRFIKKETSVQ